jgi:aspartokinase
MQEEIQAQTQKPVHTGAIVMALKRLSTDLEFRHSHKIIKTLKNIGDITVRSALIDYNFKVSDTLLAAQAKLLSHLQLSSENFYTSSRGVHECNIVVSQHLAPMVDKYLAQELCLHKEENLSSITLKLPTENVAIPGIYYFVFQRLSWEGINIYEVISTSNEFTILVNDAQVDKAFRVVKDLKQL